MDCHPQFASLEILTQKRLSLPVKNTFVHFPTCDVDELGSKRRSQSGPPDHGRGLRGAAASGLAPSGKTNHCCHECKNVCKNGCKTGCDDIEFERAETLSTDTLPTTLSGSDKPWGRSSADSDTDSSGGDSHVREYTRETLVAAPPDAKGVTAVGWTVDAERLTGSEHKVSSPIFQLAIPGLGWAPFQLWLYANNSRKVMTFEQALGQGRIELKCLDTLPSTFGNVAFNIMVGAQPRGWVVHDFSRVAQRSERRVDFAAMADSSRRTLAVEVAFAPARLT